MQDTKSDSNKINAGVFVKAKDLRDKTSLKQVPGDRPGWYRWWAPEEALAQLLNSRFVSKEYLNELRPYLQKGDGVLAGYCCVYVGIAVAEPICKRLNWHVNQHHTESAVQSRALSTLRQSIASLIVGNQYDETATNHLIDMFIIEYFVSDYSIKSKEAKETIEKIEHDEIVCKALPLNIKVNRNLIVKPFVSDLKKARGLSRKKLQILNQSLL